MCAYDTTLYWIIGILGACLVASLWYIRRLRNHLRTYEQEWIRIEELTDHNRDGDIVIHCKHIGK